MRDYRKYLSPENLSQVDNLEIKAKLVVEGFITGMHRSPYHGFSVEFAEHRHYRPGDSLRYLDWKLLARQERYYIKQFQEETNLRSMIIVDSSASMNYASSGNVTKFDYAITLAAAISYLLFRQRDSVGISTFDNKVRSFMPPKSKQSYLSEIIRTLAETQPSDTSSSAAPLDEIAERLHRRGLILIMSDFFDDIEEITRALSHFRHKAHDIVCFQILDPREIDFKFGNSSQFIDMESGEEMITQPQQIRKSYEEAMNQFMQTLKKRCRNLNIDYSLVRTNEPFDKAMREFVSKRQKSM